MIPNQEIDRLTDKMAQAPFILFLGAQCARAAGIPSVETMARQIVNLYDQDTRVAGGAVASKEVDPKELMDHFYKMLEGMSDGMRYRMLQSFYQSIPVPLFYQDLALLIKKHYFIRILTTNFDTLLEQALNGAGLEREKDYQVLSLGSTSDRAVFYKRKKEGETNPVQIIKLHGDIAQKKVSITPDEIEEALYSQLMLIKGKLKGDLVMVGYDFECDPIEEWLVKSKSHRDELWLVNSELPQPPQANPTEWAQQVIYIKGEAAKPESFFNQLSLRLLRMPVLESMSKSLDEYQEETAFDFASPVGIANRLPIDNDTLLVRDLIGRIKSRQIALSALEQTTDMDSRNVQLQAQIDYERKTIANLEDQLRDLPGSRERLIRLLERLVGTLQPLGQSDDSASLLEQGTIDFLQSQLEAIKSEFNRDQPNHHIISAAVGAAILLAERLCVESEGTLVEPEDLRELVSFAPSMETRGVI
jgi:hypothetical protein